MTDAAAPRRGGRGFLLFALAGMAVLVGLGTWQMERREWKHALIAEREAAFMQPPLQLSGTAGEADAAAWRRVTLTGSFLHEKETLVGPRARNGVPGWHVATPLRLANGRIVVVDRGWIPDTMKEPVRRQTLRPAGIVTVEGVLRQPSAPGVFAPENEPSRGQWFRVDPPALARHWALSDVAPWWVVATAAPGARDYPVGTAGLVLPPDNHLQYAMTWYSLAAALAIIAAVRARTPRRSGRA